MKYVLATNNQNKIKEIKAVLGESASVFCLKDFDLNIDVEETGSTFEENALLKASAIVKILNLPAIADDSGLEVDYLNGAPGIYSARFADEGHDDEANRQKLLKLMQGVPEKDRTAHFTTAIALCYPNGESIVVKGQAFGKITTEYKGTGGFGYDCLFMSDDLNMTFAEASQEQKNSVSHRSRALQKLKEKL